MGEEQRVVFLVFAGLAGLLVGSFLNVCIFRLPRDCMSVVRPRSRCIKCRNFIAWYDNFPVVSWLILGGKCRHCRIPISMRYALVELMTGAVFLWAAYEQLYLAQGGTPVHRIADFAIAAYLSAALIVCTFIDLEWQILPDEITVSGIALGLLAGTAFPHIFRFQPDPELVGFIPAAIQPHGTGFLLALLGALVGGGSVYLVGVLGALLFRKDAMGFGDVKLMAFLGAFLGFDGILLTFFLGVFIGAMFGIGKYAVLRRMGYVPFGPFLSAGALIMLFAGEWVHKGLKAYITWVRGGGGYSE